MDRTVYKCPWVFLYKNKTKKNTQHLVRVCVVELVPKKSQFFLNGLKVNQITAYFFLYIMKM